MIAIFREFPAIAAIVFDLTWIRSTQNALKLREVNADCFLSSSLKQRTVTGTKASGATTRSTGPAASSMWTRCVVHQHKCEKTFMLM